MIRTLWVTNDFPPRPGGIEQFLANLLAGLDPAGTRVIASPWPGDAAHDAGLAYRVDRVGRRPMLPTPALRRRVAQAAAEHRADVVVFGASWPLGELGNAVDLPTLALSHGHEAGLAKVGLGPLVRRVAQRVDALGVISDYTRDCLAPWTSATRLVTLPPGVDVTAFRPDPGGVDVRARHELAADAPLVVSIGRLVARKGFDVLLAAWPAVRRDFADAHLLIGGDGPARRGLEKVVQRGGLAASVTLVGSIGWADLPAYHAAGDVFALACRDRWRGLELEGLGIVALEAQACGTPVVIGRSGGAPESVVDGETGLVVDPTDASAVAAAIIALLGDPQRRAAMGVAGRAQACAHWAWPVQVDRLQQALGDLVA